MVDLGVGKNMVRAIRFWAHAAGMIEPAGKGSGHRVTAFGSAIWETRAPIRFWKTSEPFG